MSLLDKDVAVASEVGPDHGAAPGRGPTGREPTVSWLILKVAQLCNLNCTYCYVYNRGDTAWRERPEFMSEAVVKAIARRVAEQCAKYDLKRFVIEIHGGEPLLAGVPRIRGIFELMKVECPNVELEFIMQTNGLLLDAEWIGLFREYNVRFGISVDGPPEVADTRRVFRNGKGSGALVLRKIEKLRLTQESFAQLLSGTLCVIDPKTDGAAMVRWMMDQGFTGFDFLLPDATHANLPEGWTGAEEYGAFLIGAFDYWLSLGEAAPSIRFFEMMLMGLMGRRPGLDALGGDLRAIGVVETNGALGILDTIRICGDDFAADRFDIFSYPLDAIAGLYGIKELQRPCAACERCAYFEACRGGYLPHRYDGASFDNPSVYCKALYALAERMWTVLRHELPASAWEPQPRETAP